MSSTPYRTLSPIYFDSIGTLPPREDLFRHGLGAEEQAVHTQHDFESRNDEGNRALDGKGENRTIGIRLLRHIKLKVQFQYRSQSQIER